MPETGANEARSRQRTDRYSPPPRLVRVTLRIECAFGRGKAALKIKRDATRMQFSRDLFDSETVAISLICRTFADTDGCKERSPRKAKASL